MWRDALGRLASDETVEIVFKIEDASPDFDPAWAFALHAPHGQRLVGLPQILPRVTTFRGDSPVRQNPYSQKVDLIAYLFHLRSIYCQHIYWRIATVAFYLQEKSANHIVGVNLGIEEKL
jgi:hypothetical protein